MSLSVSDICIKGRLGLVTAGLVQGEVTVALGPNGAGKSSLMGAMTGELEPSAGQVFFRGQSLQALSLAQRSESFAGLHQQMKLDFPFTVEEVLLMGRFPWDDGPSTRAAIVHEVCEKLVLSDFRPRLFATLSEGEKQRVHIARVLIQLWHKRSEATYLFDEPTAPLDLAHQLSFLNLCGELASEGAGIFLILHDLNLALRFADRIWLLHEGEMCFDGKVEELVQADLLGQVYGVELQVQQTGRRYWVNY